MHPSLGLGMCLAAGLMTAPAQALVMPGPLAASVGCGAQAGLTAQPLPVSIPEPASKAVAILGGQISALEMITLQQQAAPVPASDPRVSAAPTALAPDTGLGCVFTPAMTLLPAQPEPTPPLSHGDFLGSIRITIGKTPFDEEWRRVSRRSLSRVAVRGMLGNPDSEGVELLALVNGWVNRKIEYTRDARLYGNRDFWASAAQTLKARKGDCEDYAILKYQMLAALGLPREHMYLTLTRDLVRKEDHTVLIVELSGQYFMLDNATPTVLPANSSHDYRAVMTLSSQGSWVHGFTSTPRVAMLDARPADYFSDRAVSRARVTGFSK